MKVGALLLLCDPSQLGFAGFGGRHLSRLNNFRLDRGCMGRGLYRMPELQWFPKHSGISPPALQAY